MSTTELQKDALLACVEIGQSLTATLEPEEVLQLIMTKVSELIDAQNWSLLLVDESTNSLRFEVAVGLKMDQIREIRLAPGEGIAGYVWQHGETLLVESVRDDPRFSQTVDQKTGFETKSIACLPLYIRGQVIGVLEVINVADMKIFAKDYLPILKILADYAAIAIDNARNFVRIQHISRTDEYTGLPNARYMHEILPELLQECKKQGESLTAVFVDIDNFKIIVDAFGHLQGSQVLREIGAVINSCLKNRDILIKYGGDEFIILFPGRDKTDSLKIVQKIRNNIIDSEFLKQEELPIRVTASFGMAAYPEDAQTKKDLLIQADNQMYQIKMSTKDGIGGL